MSKRKNQPKFDPSVYEAKGIKVDKVNEIKEAFDLFDADGSGEIDTEELREVIQGLDFDLGSISLQDLIYTLDKNQNGNIDFQEFLSAMTIDSGEVGSEEEIQKAYKLFVGGNITEIGEKGDTGITKETLRRVCNDIGDKSTADELLEMIERADVNEDGKVDYEEFKSIITRKPK